MILLYWLNHALYMLVMRARYAPTHGLHKTHKPKPADKPLRLQ